MNLLKPTDFPQIKGKAKQMVLRVQNGSRLVMSPQLAFSMGLQADGKKGAGVLIAQDKNQHLKLSAATSKQAEDAFVFKPAATGKNQQNPPFAHHNAGLAKYILDQYGIDPATKSVAFKIVPDKDWWAVQPPA